MEDKKNKQSAPQAQTHEQPPAPKKEPAFSLERLAKDCYQLFGVTPSTFAGATYKLPKDKQFTVTDMKAIIKKWLDTPVKLKKAVK